MATNASYASPTADAQFPLQPLAVAGVLSRLTQNISGWTIALSLFLGLVLYDQCTTISEDTSDRVKD